MLGAKVREAPQLKALGLLDDDAIRNDVQAPASVGYPVPVTAYLPKVCINYYHYHSMLFVWVLT